MKPGKKHARCDCGSTTVTTKDALGRPRQRCPQCEGVSGNGWRAQPSKGHVEAREQEPATWSPIAVHNNTDRD